ncbi:CHASE domain-containing protein [Neptuniibacter sp. 1_MG-2023]|uniref:CHASE domain-containing protein n=1 Tax=Neptuniibacter sp. 1_MG-2023 TaxID=3062662 RepID=UPI0026E2B35B|nr:CHASE domain-containing protein [Neptuniibacter sp. 1_MG-2023]MDO6593567.1 CHASE domain-containing protein [Neptuniibacter sp. 1_MG-2023]
MKETKLNRYGFSTLRWPLVIGLLTTMIIAWMLDYQNKHDIKAYTNGLADKTENLIKERFQLFEYGLRGARGAIATAGVNEVTRKQFERYVNSRDIDNEFPGALGFGFIRRVPPSQEASFLARARQDGAPDFTIRALSPHEEDRFVIQYIYPIYKNRQAMGLDIGSESNRRSAALAAARDNKAYITNPITLVQANRKARKGVLILLPVYSHTALLTTVESREESVLGWAYAPLIIDDVLSDIDLLTDNASITLSNVKEEEPFFSVLDTYSSKLLKDSAVVRDVLVMGQHWKMTLTPTVEATDLIKSWNMDWVIAIGLGLTLCGLLVISLLRNGQVGEDQYDEILKADIHSLSIFFKSARFNRSWPYIFLILCFVFSVSSWFIVKSHLSSVSNELLKVKESVLLKLDNEATQFKRDVIFLANTPSISDLLNNQVEGVDSQNRLLSHHWYGTLADIFKAYMLAIPDVHQVRLIEAGNGWQESVKVQRDGDELEVYAQEELQFKGDEPYIAKTLQVGAGKVYVSNINLNREYGKIEQPARPVWRFSTPIFNEDGTPLAIVIVNVSADRVLNSFASNLPAESELYITNQAGDFLLHPNVEKTFTFEYGNPYRWDNEFKEATFLHKLSAFNMLRFDGQKGYVLADQGRFSLDEQIQGSRLEIYSVISQFFVVKKIAFNIAGVFCVFLILGFLVFVVQYWMWLNEKIRQRNALAVEIEAQRNKEMLRFKALLGSAPDATFVIDQIGIIKIVNAQAESMFGYDRVELEGLSIYKILPATADDGDAVHLMEYVEQPEKLPFGGNEEFLARRRDGKEFPVEISLNTVNIDEKLLVLASVRDISDRLAIEEKLRRALHDAEQATEAKSAFLANTSHEIRTPLNAVIGLTYLLNEEQLTDSQHRLVSKIQISGKSLLGIVNDVLDLSKIEANEMALEQYPLDLPEFFEEVSSVFAVQAEAKNIDFTCKLDPNLPSWVLADEVRLRQILVNLLSNAFKFTTIGKVSVRAEVQPEVEGLPDNHVSVRLSVSDTGIGISDESKTRLFNPFTQADSSTTRRFGGTGLGLSIVSKLVSLMGGTLGVESTEGVGSVFWVSLPLRAQTSDEIILQENQNRALFVLIAEDDPNDAKQLQEITRALGWRSEIVSNGKQLIQSFVTRQEENLRPPDAMIVDWQMPEMDGLDAINILANKEDSEKLPAILMISAHDSETIKKHDTEHLVNRFLHKPVNASALFNAINDAVTLHTGNAKRVLQSTHTEAVSARWLPGIRLLVVDDSPTNLEVVSHILEHNGALVETAGSGEEALERLQDRSNDYDAVLMDVQMPGIDGLETTQRIRHQLGLSSLPIIALTAGALLEEKNRALDAGMNNFLTKPIDPSKLINVLRISVEAYRSKDIPIEAINAAAPDRDTWPDISGLNHAQAKKLLLGDEQLFLDTLDNLLQEYANLMVPPAVDFDKNRETDQRLQIASQVHKLRSVSGMVGAEKIQLLAAEIETALRAENEPVMNLLSELALALQTLQQASSRLIDARRKEKDSAVNQESNLSSNLSEPVFKQDVVEHILTLLTEQDLSALAKVEEHSAMLREALGYKGFKELNDSLMKLNFEQAASLVGALIKTSGAEE